LRPSTSGGPCFLAECCSCLVSDALGGAASVPRGAALTLLFGDAAGVDWRATEAAEIDLVQGGLVSGGIGQLAG